MREKGTLSHDIQEYKYIWYKNVDFNFTFSALYSSSNDINTFKYSIMINYW